MCCAAPTAVAGTRLRSGTAPAPTTPALAAKRPVFHSEADFQHAFAWEIHQHLPDAYVRLEYRPALLPTRAYVDVWVVDGNQTLAIELKYKTAPLSVQLDDGEKFDLMSQGAQDLGRYDFVRDLWRLEQVLLITQTL
jgi:hypothetical protein